MLPPRPATEARSGSLEPGRPSRARSANTRHPAGRPQTPPADRMYATDVRRTDVRQHHRLSPRGRGHKIINVRFASHTVVLMLMNSSVLATGAVQSPSLQGERRAVGDLIVRQRVEFLA